MSDFLPERKWFRCVIFSDSMLMGMVELVFSMLAESNENAQSPRSPSGLLAFATPVTGFYRRFVAFFPAFCYLTDGQEILSKSFQKPP
jgi:hypothetical protein